jgi:pSer/pThr/pTyr-binding forkhead associated (FHA) protein
MTPPDFPTWYSASVYGGIGCALLSAVSIASWSLWRRRGVTGRVIVALLTCVVASALDIGPLLWIEYRLSIYGPTLSVREVSAALTIAAFCGWVAPLAAMSWYILIPTPAPVAAPLRVARVGSISPAALDDPARSRLAYPDGRPWALLIPLVEGTAGAPKERPIELVHALTLIGREPDNDIVLDDDRISRRHAELRWERGRVELADYGSLNGTLINSQAARGRIPLRDGDIIDLGKRRFTLNITQADATEAKQTDSPSPMETVKTKKVSGPIETDRPMAMLSLIQSATDSAIKQWPLSAPITTIGRDATCGVTLTDASVSRVHAQITRQPAGYFITDLQSSNGVTVNGQGLEGPVQVFAGDVIAVGDCLLRFEEASTSATSTLDQREPLAATGQMYSTPRNEPSFHMRIAPQWNVSRDSRPRLAPPRLTPRDADEHQPTPPALPE